MPIHHILFDPEVTEGGSGAAEETVSIPRSELDALRARVAAQDATDGQDARLRAVETAFAEELAAKAQQAAEWERACKAAVLERELASALAGKSLVPGAVTQLIKLWREDFEVLDAAGASRVLARDGRSVGQIVTERLASPDFAHFCQAGSRGGTAVPASSRSMTIGADHAPVRNLGEAAIQRWKDTMAGSSDAVKSVGLRGRR